VVADFTPYRLSFIKSAKWPQFSFYHPARVGWDHGENMSCEVTITVLAEKMELKKAMRIHFAGMVMQGFLSNSIICEAFNGLCDGDEQKCPALIANRCVVFANALIDELEKRETPVNQQSGG
jgi:hypothetical protein